MALIFPPGQVPIICKYFFCQIYSRAKNNYITHLLIDNKFFFFFWQLRTNALNNFYQVYFIKLTRESIIENSVRCSFLADEILTVTQRVSDLWWNTSSCNGASKTFLCFDSTEVSLWENKLSQARIDEKNW